ncbi:pyridoxal phosphate-dependent transferase [Radiomyces spectabilis]|uniref:pyridoxal phosphate-dependent transferase n=1 Tax=Radiomyces spectabilis TaxID=64574 RepID=UPI00221F9722|nr:pyridoxal phosphate-dependent transferase [Radiomyces spectabilis]KAI8393389.1 pyridoxal phosphate-dependent transferase [Radiomyces spectabilis]
MDPHGCETRTSKEGHQRTLQALDQSDRYTLPTYSRPDIIIERGKGAFLFDTEGRSYLDFTAGIAVTALGHADATVAQVLYDQATKLVHISNAFHNENAGKLAQKIITTTRQHGGDWAYQLFFSNSGTEANEGALKFARKWGKHIQGNDKYEVVCFTNAFHGRSMGALSATFNPKYREPFSPLVPGFVRVPFNDTEQATRAITEKTCAVIIEPIQGEGGIHAASAEFLKALRSRCNEKKALLIFDEIQCGLGRTGKLWAHQHYGQHCQPDMLTMAKPLANGIPIGAVMTNAKVADMLVIGDHGTTFGGNPLATAAALSVFERISEPAFLDTVTVSGALLKDGLMSLKEQYPDIIQQVRGQGLLLGLQFSKDPAPLVKIARKHGLLILTGAGNTVRIVPPLNIKPKELCLGLEKLGKALQQFL